MPESPKSLPQKLSCKHLQDGICKLLMQGPLREGLTRISARFSAKDLCRIMQGPLREESAGFSQEPVYARSHNENATDPELENPAAQTLREPAQSKCTWASHKSNFTREFTGKQPQDR